MQLQEFTVIVQSSFSESITLRVVAWITYQGLSSLYYVDQQQSSGAIVVCGMQEAVRHRASYADAYTGMGVSLKELKRKEEAEQCFAQVVRLRPGCALSLGNLAGIVLSDADSAWA